MDATDLIRMYFDLGLSYVDIVEILSSTHNITISLRNLKRKLHELHLDRRKTYADYADIFNFVEAQLRTSGQMHGYRWMANKCVENGLKVRREDVRIILQTIDGAGVSHRKARKLNRRVYFSKGPNFIWHTDCYDKLKPYGICISGCIDGYSRHIIWLHASTNTSDPRIIGNYFINEVRKRGGCPQRLRGDLGTENSLVRDFQRFFQNRFSAYLEGASTHNQRIESWWGQFRKQCTEFWIALFSTLRDNGDFDGCFIDKSILQFCFMQLIRVCVCNYYSTYMFILHFYH